MEVGLEDGTPIDFDQKFITQIIDEDGQIINEDTEILHETIENG